MFHKIGVLKKFAKITGKHLCRSPFLIRFAGCSTFFIEHLSANAFKIVNPKCTRVEGKTYTPRLNILQKQDVFANSLAIILTSHIIYQKGKFWYLFQWKTSNSRISQERGSFIIQYHQLVS